MEFKVTGIEEVCAMIDNFPKTAIKRAISKGLVAAAEPIFTAIQARKPSDGYVGGMLKPGELQEGLQTVIEVKEDGSGGHMAIGFDKKTAAVARYLEFGHKKLGSAGQLMKYISGKGSRKGKLITRNKPGADVDMVKPYPFVRPAIEASQDEALEVFISAVKTSLESES